MKALILCAGQGSRLWPVTLSLPKHLIPIGTKPILGYIIDSLIDADVKEIGIVVNNDNYHEFDKYIRDDYRHNQDLNFEFIKQNQPLGIAHGLLLSKDFIGNDEFIMVLGDNYYDLDLKKFITGFKTKGSNARLLLKKVDDPERFGVVVLEKEEIINVIEKPKDFISDMAVAGIYIFDKNIFDGCLSIKKSQRGEYEITDAIKWLIDKGFKVTYDICEGIWRDLGIPDDIIEINKHLLKDTKKDIQGKIDGLSIIMGEVILGQNSRIVNSTLKGPLIIGKNTLIENSYIGPFSTIHSNVKIVNSSIEKSIILDGCEIEDISSIIESSLLERDTKIALHQSVKDKIQLILGRGSRVILSKKQ